MCVVCCIVCSDQGQKPELKTFIDVYESFVQKMEQPPLKLKYKTQYVLTYLGFLNCDIIENIANLDKAKLSKITKDDLCKIVHKFCVGINKFATYYDKGIIMQFKDDMSDIHYDEQKELLTKLVRSLKSPSRREAQGSATTPAKSPPRSLEKHPRSILKSSAKTAKDLSQNNQKSPAQVAKDLSQTFDQGTSGAQQTAPAVANSEDGPVRVAEKAPLAKDSGLASEVITPEKPVPTPEKASQMAAKPQPPKEKGICRFYRQNKCRHSNTEGDMCEYKHPGVCKVYQLAGDTDKGCQNSTCQELHPALCGKWKKGGWTGPCGNQECKKIHPSIPKSIPIVNNDRPKKNNTAPPGDRPVVAPWTHQQAWKEGRQPFTSPPSQDQAYFEKRFQDMQRTMMDQMKSMMQAYMLPPRTYQNQFPQPPPSLPQYHQQTHHPFHQHSTFQQQQPAVPQPGTTQHPSFQQGQTNHRPADLQQNHQQQHQPLYN